MTETKVPGVTLGGKPMGTSLQGYMPASYRDLVRLLGPPNVEGDGYKVSTEWVLTWNGQVYTLYDYKETDLYDSDGPTVEEFRAQEGYDWHVGANGHAGDFVSIMTHALNDLEDEDDKASPESKEFAVDFEIPVTATIYVKASDEDQARRFAEAQYEKKGLINLLKEGAAEEEDAIVNEVRENS